MMTVLKLIFFVGLFIIFYSYLGYGLLIWVMLKVRRLFRRTQPDADEKSELPAVTIVVAAFNEESYIIEKIENTLSLDYPSDKLSVIFITDGSTDNTYYLAKKYKEILVLHEHERKGKIAAIHRAMSFVSTPIVVFSDANTLLNTESIKNIARHYSNKNIGGVAGEKRILTSENEKVAGSGEGLYWKYESFLKKLDSEFYTVVGAAGELFSIRTNLYEYVGRNILLDDFIISLKICKRGYRIAYEPDAYALEAPSDSLQEEQKRKIRISAGAFQSIVLLKDLLNIFRYPLLSFQYISHRLLRWTLCPIFLPLIFVANILIEITHPSTLFTLSLVAQGAFYFSSIVAWYYSKSNVKIKVLYVAYYFVFINLSLYLGFYRYIKGTQSVLWDKAIRKKASL